MKAAARRGGRIRRRGHSRLSVRHSQTARRVFAPGAGRHPGVVWRSVGHSQNSFFMGGFIDESRTGGQDPFDFRRSLLASSRAPGVRSSSPLKRPTGASRCRPASPGIAVVFSFGSGARGRGGLVSAPMGPPKCWVVAGGLRHDGEPDIVKRQIESAIVYGLTAALYERSRSRRPRRAVELHDYRMLRMSEMPKVEVHIVPSKEAPGNRRTGTPRSQPRWGGRTRSSPRRASASASCPAGLGAVADSLDPRARMRVDPAGAAPRFLSALGACLRCRGARSRSRREPGAGIDARTINTRRCAAGYPQGAAFAEGTRAARGSRVAEDDIRLR